MPVALLGDRDALGVFGRMIQHARIDQPVMDDDIGALERLDCAQRQQPGIARTGTDKDYAPARMGIEQ
jgi:hypothetical protein